MALSVGSVRAQENGVLREVYLGIAGRAVSDLISSPNYPDAPDTVEILPIFEAPIDVADLYGQRMTAYVTAPETGDYTFWISADDGAVLYLSSDDTPANKQEICTVPGWTSSRQWSKYPEQQSGQISLTGGQRYYIEALMKEDGGGDNLAVQWQLPTSSIESPIPGTRLEVFGLGPPVISVHPVSQTVSENGEVTFTVELESGLGATYQWQRNGADIPGASEVEYVIQQVSAADNGARFRCEVTNGSGSDISDAATLTVDADTTRPRLEQVSSLGSRNWISVQYSEPVDPVTGLDPSKYSIDQGVSVLSARFGVDETTVNLETTALTVGTPYILRVTGVLDQAAQPNAILSNAQISFSLDYDPLPIEHLRGVPEPLGPSRRRSALVITEIMYNPAPRMDGFDTEFVEIHNADTLAVDLGGYRLSGDIDYTVPASTILAPGGFLVIAPSPADVQAVYGISGVQGGFESRLSNGGGTVRLRHPLNGVLCEAEFDDEPPWPAAADNGGHSLVLARPSYGEDDVRAWAASREAGGSPGAVEPTTSSPWDVVLINEILAHTDDPLVDYVELFNYDTAAVDVSGCVLTDDPTTNRYVFPVGTQIPGKGYLLVDQTDLGFSLSAAGETVYLKAPDGLQAIDVIRFGPQAQASSWGRTPDGSPDFDELASRSPGTANGVARVRTLVINEIMYHPPVDEDAGEYVELLHTGSSPLDIGGWRLDDGIDYTFPAGTTIAGGGLLVVARDRLGLLAARPGLDPAVVVGDFDGGLSNGGERIRLEMPEDLVSLKNGVSVTNRVFITVDEVTYRDGGRWPEWADGGGSSMELIDPQADNRLAANWADSVETGKSTWVTVEHTGILDHGRGAINELQAMLLAAGECLVDDLEVVWNGGNQVTNGSLDAGFDGWVVEGNHVASGLSQPGEGYGGGRALHVRASSGGDNGANRVEIDLSTSLTEGSSATIRAKARWLRGHPDLLLRLHGNHLEALGTLPIPDDLGTPGRANSQALANAGPAIHQVTHTPVLPSHGQPVTVLARVHDPDGLAGLAVRYRLDPDDEVLTEPMVNRGAGWFAAELPGQASNALLAYYIEATDAAAAAGVSTFPADPAGRECLIRFGDPTPTGDLGVYRLWMTEQNLDTWIYREKLSNQAQDGTLVLGNFRVIYNAGARYRGSPWIRPRYTTPLDGLTAYVWSVPKDDPVLGTNELNLDTLEPNKDNTYQRERTSFWIAEQLGVPFSAQRYVKIMFNGVERGEVYADVHQPNSDYIRTWYPSDDRGEIYKIDDWFEFNDSVAKEFNENGQLGLYTTTGGAKKKARYRWSWERKSNRGLDDDYSRFFAMVDAVHTTGSQYVPAVEASIDVEQWMRVFAVRRIVGDWDGYSFNRGKNQFTYKPDEDKWKMLLWDLDFSLGSGRAADHGLFEQVNDPVIQRMYAEPALVRHYWRAMHDAVYGPLVASKVDPTITARYAMLAAQGVAAADPSGVTSWIASRRSYILGQLNAVSSGFAITLNGGANFSTNDNLVTLTGTAPVGVRDITVNGSAYPVSWTDITTWEIEIALGPGANPLQLGAVDSYGAQLGLTDSITITYTGASEDPANYLVINEIMYNAAVPDAAFVEIHNRSLSTAFDLTGYRLEGADFDFPAGVVLQPGDFVVVANNLSAYVAAYGSADPVIGVMDGRLDNGGETLRLIRLGATPEDDVLIDTVSYEDDPPWPALADGFGPSLQLIDPTQDNNRVANWTAVAGSMGETTTNVVVDYPDLWMYHDLGQDLGTAWRESGYDDGDWEEGSGLLAEEDSPLPKSIGTAINKGSTITFYFRKTFTFAGDPAATELRLQTIIDDGAVFYLNGTEIHRLGMAAGEPAYTTTASRTVSNADYEGVFTVSSSALQVGENVLAVEVHQTSATSSDVVFGMNLTAVGLGGLSSTPGAPNLVDRALPLLPALWLNEVQPGNATGPADGAGDRDPWVEIYNGGPSALALDDFFLSPDFTADSRWAFPAGTSIGAGEFLVVWVDDEPGETSGLELHADFLLPRMDGTVALVRGDGDGLLVDYLHYDVLLDDRSHGAYPDGTSGKRVPFYYATPGAPNNAGYPATPITINEWMAANTGTVYDPADGKAEDWFELYNEGPDPVDLSGFTLTDDLADPNQFVIPAGTVVGGRDFLLVWADDDSEQNQPGSTDLHTSFRLSRSGESLGLYAPNGDPVNTLSFGPQVDDLSSGRLPDGSAAFDDLATATPGASNLATTEENFAPQMDSIPDHTVGEETELRLTVSAFDPNPGQQLTYALAPGAPDGASLNPQSGVLVWTPTEAQGPGNETLIVVVTDNGAPPLSNSTSFAVSVSEVNRAPTLTPLSELSVLTGELIERQPLAADPDLPAQGLSFSLLPGAPDGAGVDPDTGLFQWTPDASHIPGPHTITVVVTDSGTPPLNAASTFSVTVSTSNISPAVDPIPDQTVDEETELRLTVSASDANPGQQLTYVLAPGAPAGASLDPQSGVLVWTPTEAQGPGNETLTVMVTDNGAPPLSNSTSFAVSVAEVNRAPTLTPLSDLSVLTEELIERQPLGADPDLPAQGLSFSLLPGAPDGAGVDPDTGLFQWTPDASHIPGPHAITVVVTDNGSPPRNAASTFSVTVSTSNIAPAIDPIPDQTVDEETELRLTVSASDPNPGQQLTYALAPGAPAGASLDPQSGVLVWTPTEAQGPGNETLTVVVADNGAPPLSNSASFAVSVAEVNRAPTLAPLSDLSVLTGELIERQPLADDPDLPAQDLSFSLLPGAPAGAGVDPDTGLFQWTPDASHIPGPHAITVVVTDTGTPPRNAASTFSVTVSTSNIAPDIDPIPDQTGDEETELRLTVSASDANPGQQLTYALAPGAPVGASVHPQSGVLVWTPTEVQGPSNETLTVMVADNGAPPLSNSTSFAVSVAEVNRAPTLTPLSDLSVLTGELIERQPLADDPDLPAQSLNFSLLPGAPAGAGVDPDTGLFQWTPDASHIPGPHAITVVVTDTGTPPRNAASTFSVTVSTSNIAPDIDPIPDQTVDEETELRLTVSASDPNPGQQLTYALAPGAPAGTSLDPQSGVLVWTPTDVQGPGNETLTVVVADNGAPPLSNSTSFAVSVAEVNRAPTLASLSDLSVLTGELIERQPLGADPDLPAQGLSFSLLPGAPDGAGVDPDTGLFQWTPDASHIPGPHAITVVVTDNGAPPRNATSTFSVTVTAPVEVRFLGISHLGGNRVRLDWVPNPAGSISVQGCDNLDNPNWNRVVPDPSPPVDLDVSESPYRWFRIVAP